MDKNHNVGFLLALSFLLHISYLYAGTSYEAYEVAPQIVVRGVVTDVGGEPLIGAAVQNVRKKSGVVTDLNGQFEIRTSVGEKWTVSYIGMKPYEFVVKSEKKLRIVLESDVQALAEVVVTGYSKVNSRLFVGAVTKVSTQDFLSAPQADFSRLLEGKAPGLNISSVSSTFGAAPKVNIRGGSSIHGNVQPLWVVDGAVVEDMVALNEEQLASGDAITLVSSTLAGLNPADIESIEVLKDASATSLYGARGMNGVIVVESKAGKRGKGLNVTYNLTTSLRLRPSYTQFDMMNSAETMQVYHEMENKGYFTMNRALYGRRGGVYSQMYQLIDTFQQGGFGLPNTLEARRAFLHKASTYNTDWFKHIYTQSLTQNHSLSLSYGGEKSATYASVSFYNDPGETVAEKVKRFTGFLNSSFFLSPRLKVSANLQANFREQRAPGTFPRIRNLEAGAYKRDFDINPFNYALNTSRTLRPYDEAGNYEYYRNDWAPFNILQEYQENYMRIRVSDFRFSLSGEWEPVKKLRLSLLLNTRMAVTGMAHFLGENSNVLWAYRADRSLLERQHNIYLYRPEKGEPQVILPMGGVYQKSSQTMNSYLGRASLDYVHEWGGHRMKWFSFAEVKINDLSSDSFKGYGIGFNRANSVMTSPLVFEKTLNEGEDYFALHDHHERDVVFSSSLTYDYRNRYILNLVGNYEGSNAAGIGRRVRWLPTWNVGVKWNVDVESFFAPFRHFWNQFSLRMSYGLVAKMNSEAINSLPVYDSRLTFRKDISDREYAIYIQHLENRDLTWEKMYEFNVGTDLSFWNDRISCSLDVYSRRSFDLIDWVQTSGIGGEYKKWMNFGDMKTVGLDFLLNTQQIRQKDFSWNTVWGFSFYHQEITRLLNQPTTFDMVAGNGRGNIEGFPRGGLYSFDLRGLTDRGLPQFYFGNLPLSSNGYSQIAGANFYDATYNRSYLLYEGPSEPFITTSLENTFRYKGWSLSVFLTSRMGNKVRISPRFDPEYNDLNVFTTRYRDRWLVKGDEQTKHIPVIPGYDIYSLMGKKNVERAYNTYNYSQVNVADGSFVRLKSLSLGYTFPRSVCEKMKMKGLSLYAQVTNPFLIYADKKLQGRDPEFINSGGVSSPTPRTYSMSVQLSF